MSQKRSLWSGRCGTKGSLPAEFLLTDESHEQNIGHNQMLRNSNGAKRTFLGEWCTYSLLPGHFGWVLLGMPIDVVMKAGFQESVLDVVPLQLTCGNSCEHVAGVKDWNRLVPDGFGHSEGSDRDGLTCFLRISCQFPFILL